MTVDNYQQRQLPDGRWLCVFPLTFGRARLGISPAHNRDVFDDTW